jgi:NAD(P)-dependent dehydrogenase (short-subunit alcohol dehydrogenase family)
MTAQPDLNGKIALITGASRGIGAVVALELAKHSAHIIAIARTTSGLEELDDKILEATGKNATLLPMDLSKLSEVEKIGPTIAERFGRLDILIANAATLGPMSPVGHIKPKEWDQVMKLNFHTNTQLIRTCDPLLRQSPAGRILFTTCAAANAEKPYQAPYAASKAALEAYVKTYAQEVRETNMKIHAVNPGPVKTKLLEAIYPGSYPDGVQEPEDVTDMFLKKLN